MTSSSSSSCILMTSLDEIKSFNPCVSGWKDILAGRNEISVTAELFPLVECVKHCTISDVLWLIGKRKTEIQIAVKFARMCVNSVAHLRYDDDARYTADARYDDARSARYAAHAARYAYAAYAAYAAATAATAADVSNQQEKNKLYLITAILNHAI